MQTPDEFVIELLFDKMSDGRFHIHSPSVPGLHLAGMDLTALRADIEPVVKDLLRYNSNIIVRDVRWVPSLDEVMKQFTWDKPTAHGRATFVARRSNAAA